MQLLVSYETNKEKRQVRRVFVLASNTLLMDQFFSHYVSFNDNCFIVTVADWSIVLVRIKNKRWFITYGRTNWVGTYLNNRETE